MVDPPLLFIGVSVILTALYVAVNNYPRLRSLLRITARDGAVSASSTSLPPVSEKKPRKPAASDSLPPLRRDALLQVLRGGRGCAKTVKDIKEEDIKESPLPMSANYHSAPGKLYTPTGISVEEIRSLGDFPDYETLSGIPLPDAYPEFDIDKALPRPYRPFRWSYHQTMSLTKLETNWWIELENTYRERIEQRKELYEKFGKAILDSQPGSELACKETMELVLEYICTRYPHYFSLSDDKKFFKNGILGTVENLKGKHPLHILLENVPEDFVVMMRDDKSGIYYFRAGVICSSLGWDLGSKMGLPLNEIHGPVPEYKEKMQFSMDRYFSKMPTDKPIQRSAWNLEIDKPLYMAPGDPHEKIRHSQDPSLTLSRCTLRVDWQTLRRAPLSGALIFNYKALFTPVTEFRDEPGVPALLAKVIKQGNKTLIEHKNTWHVEHVVLPALEEWIEEQVQNGMVDRDWQVATLDDSPHFQGWEEKWHRQQGF